MAFEKHIVDRLSTRLPSLLPEHIRQDSPVFEMFLKAYYEYLESEIIVLKSQDELEGIRLEDGTSETAAAVLIETGTASAEPDVATSKLIYESEKEPFQVGEYIYGEKSGSVAKINVINGLTLIIDTISGTGFAEEETITGRDGNLTGIVETYKENSVVANNRLLDYSDIDQTLETFLKYFQKDFIPSLDLKDTQNARLTLKNIGSLYKQKGTAESVKFLMRLLYGQDAEIKYPIDETIFASDSAYSEERRVSITMELGGTPKVNDKLVQYNETDSSIIDADAVVESVQIIDLDNRKYGLSISLTHRGEFVENKEACLIDRDGVTIYKGTLRGIVSTIDPTNGSIYAVDLSTSELKWKTHIPDRIQSASLIVSGDVLYSIDRSGVFYAIDIDAGTILNSIPFNSMGSAGPSIGADAFGSMMIVFPMGGGNLTGANPGILVSLSVDESDDDSYDYILFAITFTSLIYATIVTRRRIRN